MPDLSEFGAANNLPTDDLIAISEAQVLNTESRIYQSILQKVAEKYVEQAKAREADTRNQRRRRVYVPYTIAPVERYRLTADFPQFDIHYSVPVTSPAAYAKTVSLLVSEYLLTQMPPSNGKTVLYGYKLKPTLMRNRGWVHFELSSGDPETQVEFLRTDRELTHIYDSHISTAKRLPEALDSYINGTSDVVCHQAHTCTYKATMAAAVLDGVDTNYRQLATWMDNHGSTLLHFAVPGNKAMELGFDGPFPELGGYVAHTDGVVNIIFPDGPKAQMSFTHRNYLELIARTRLVYNRRTYVKEFTGRVHGYLLYKVTAVEGSFPDDDHVYRSWIDPNYRDTYVMQVPVLKPKGNPNVSADWRVVASVIRRNIVDEIMDVALSADGVKLEDVIAKRIYSKSHNFIVSGQFTRADNPLNAQDFVHAMMLIYTQAYMRKFHSGAVLSAVAPELRAAHSNAYGVSNIIKSAISGCKDSAYDYLVAPFASKARDFQHSVASRNDVVLPSYAVSTGYVRYSDTASDNPSFLGWYPSDSDPSWGYCSHLPKPGVVPNYYRSDPTMMHYDTVDELPPAKSSFMTRLAGIGRFVSDIVNDDSHVVGDMLAGTVQVHQSTHVQSFSPPDGSDAATSLECTYAGSSPVRLPSLHVLDVRDLDPVSRTEQADKLVSRFVGEIGATDAGQVEYVTNAYLSPRVTFERMPGSMSVQPVQDATEAVMRLFPASLLMDTSHIESERLHSETHIVMRTIRTKVDMSRLEGLKPEAAFRPLIRGHVLPNIKETGINVLSTLAKRNADTPYSMTESDTLELWKRVVQAMQKVYFVPGALDWLAQQEPIQSTTSNVREWLFKQSETKLNKLLQADSLLMVDMALDVDNLHLMLKGKLKPEMDRSYETAVKLPQSVQYDSSGRSVLLLSPAFRDVVKREQMILRPNVMVMQRKSVDDAVNFLNMFDHRTDKRGKRRYIEIDEAMFDKAQVHEVAQMYLRYLKLIGLYDEYVAFVEKMFTRSVSSPKAGVKIELRAQNVSGAPFTLHRNNTVSMIIMSLFLQGLGDKIEFIMMMGDDVTVAIRGDVDISTWESELNRMFNMSAKIELHDHGYICSQDIVHRPDGTTALTRDLVKALLSLMQQSLKDEDKFREMEISMRDSMKHIDDSVNQAYLVKALPGRWKKILPGATSEVFHLIIRVFTALVRGETTLRDFYSSSLFTIFH